MANRLSLLADIGGTNARFATADPESPAPIHELTLPTSAFPSLPQAMSHYLDATGQSSPQAICVAVAGPVSMGSARLTNNTWEISTADLRTCFNIDTVRVLNDFEAIAYALPELGRSHVVRLGGPAFVTRRDRQTFGVIGAGTGLGAAGLATLGSIAMPLITEAGHVGFAPETDVQAFIHRRLRKRYTRISDERLASGQGIANIYWALSERDAADPEGTIDAATIFERCESGDDPIATSTIDEFFRILGQVAGNLALSIGAYDGMFIAGGIAQRHKQALLASAFRSGFDAKGRHRALMETIPTLLIEHPQPGLLGTLIAVRAQPE